jgi:hypothetical protein
MNQKGTKEPDPRGRLLGLTVFVLGVVLLLFVFYAAYAELTGSAMGQLSRPASGGPDMGLVLSLVLKAIFLFLLGYLASAVASRGIGLYQAARGEQAE